MLSLHYFCLLFFFFNDPATTEIYTLSLHDALPIFDVFLAVTLLDNGVRRLLSHNTRDFAGIEDRKSTRLNSSHLGISYAVFCLKKKKQTIASHDAGRQQLKAIALQ